MTKEELDAITRSIEIGGAKQTFWYKVSSLLFSLIISMAVFQFLELQETDKSHEKVNNQQDKAIASNASDIAVLNAKSVSMDKWRENTDNRLERIRYKK